MRSMLLGVALLCCIALHEVAAHPFVLLEKWKDQYRPMYVSDSGDYSFDPNSASDPKFQLAVHTIVNHSFVDQGWDYTYFRQTEALNMVDSFHAVGYAEGYLTRANITEQLKYVPSVSENATQWITAQVDFMRGNVNLTDVNNSKVENFWHRIDCLFSQMEGLVEGYNTAAAAEKVPAINFMDIYMLNFQNEIQDVEFAIWGNNYARTSRPGASMFIKYTDYDLYAGHNSIVEYSTMRRQYKSYCMDTVISFSGYPGKIASGDDWYLTNTRLAIQSAPLYVWDQELYTKHSRSTSTPQFLRLLIATYMSSDASTVGEYLQMNNSGTGNAQYHVLAMKRFRGGKIKSELFYQVEQIPGLTIQADLTANLSKKGYWISVDVPVQPNISVAANYAEQQEKEKIWGLTPETNPRIDVFETVVEEASKDGTAGFNFDTMKAVMRHNSYSLTSGAEIPDCMGAGKHDRCDPAKSSMFSIAARGDINPLGEYGPAVEWIGQVPRGATDTKIISQSDLREALDGLVMAGTVISGPTNVVNGELQPFVWSKSPFNASKPKDLPDMYNYTWMRYTVPYPPHGHYNGYTPIGQVITGMVVPTVVAAIVGAVLVQKVLGKKDETEDPYSESAGLLKYKQNT